MFFKNSTCNRKQKKKIRTEGTLKTWCLFYKKKNLIKLSRHILKTTSLFMHAPALRDETKTAINSHNYASNDRTKKIKTILDSQLYNYYLLNKTTTKLGYLPKKGF